MRDTFFSTGGDRGKHNALGIGYSGNAKDTVRLDSRWSEGKSTEAQAEDSLLAAASPQIGYGRIFAPNPHPGSDLLCTFGLKLSVNSILGAYYAKDSPKLWFWRTGKIKWSYRHHD